MRILNSIVKSVTARRRQQINTFRKYPFDVQKDTLFSLLKSAKDTQWGKKYDYGSINTIIEFQERVPFQYYEDTKPFIDRIREGEKDLLWPGEIKWFAKSSGTTSDKSKFIPVSKDSMDKCHIQGGRDVLNIYINNNPDSGIFTGKGLTLGGSHKLNNFNNKSYYGDLSAVLIENMPWWTDLIRTPSRKIALLSEWEEKLEQITKISIKRNVKYFAGVPSWNLVLMKHILDFTGKQNLLEIWPELELFIHGGVSFTPYREQFEKLIPSDNMKYMETYNASEGFFALQDDPAYDDMLLMLDYGVFYEFIPLEKINDKKPEALTINEIEIDKNYALVITTNSGLWRYIIGDTVIFSSKEPYKIRISGRTKHFINAFGEEIIIDNAEKALKEACNKTGAMISEYTAAPVYMEENRKGSHEWLIEFEKEPENIEHFTEALDKTLISLNSDYEAKRYKNITMSLPIVRSAKKGVFYQWLKDKGKLGGQNKVPRLSNTRKYMDELLIINDKM